MPGTLFIFRAAPSKDSRLARLLQHPSPPHSTAMPSQDAWGLALQFLPAYLAGPSTSAILEGRLQFEDHGGWYPNKHRQEGRDLLAMVLAQTPHSPVAYHAHSEAKLLLLRRALSSAQQVGIEMLHWRRHEVVSNLDRASAADSALNMQRPQRPMPPRRRTHYPEVFWAAPALGETEERARWAANHLQEMFDL